MNSTTFEYYRDMLCSDAKASDDGLLGWVIVRIKL